MVLVLSREGTPVLQPVFYAEATTSQETEVNSDEKLGGPPATARAMLSRRLVDELAMQRRDILALHIASDPSLALDLMVFVLADAETHDWHGKVGSTLRAGSPNGPLIGFEPGDAAATVAFARMRAELDEGWRAGETMSERFDMFCVSSDEVRARWLGYVVARSLEASLNLSGDRQIPFHDHLGTLIGIDVAAWWRPTAANFFDRVPKPVILDALAHVGGVELSTRYASVKKTDLAMSAERIFAGATIAEVHERDRALAWVPEAMRFAGPSARAADDSEIGGEVREGGEQPVAAPENDETHDIAA